MDEIRESQKRKFRFAIKKMFFVVVLGLISYYFGGLQWLVFFLLFVVALLFADAKAKEDVLERVIYSLLGKKVIEEKDVKF